MPRPLPPVHTSVYRHVSVVTFSLREVCKPAVVVCYSGDGGVAGEQHDGRRRHAAPHHGERRGPVTLRPPVWTRTRRIVMPTWGYPVHTEKRKTIPRKKNKRHKQEEGEEELKEEKKRKNKLLLIQYLLVSVFFIFLFYCAFSPPTPAFYSLFIFFFFYILFCSHPCHYALSLGDSPSSGLQTHINLGDFTVRKKKSVLHPYRRDPHPLHVHEWR